MRAAERPLADAAMSPCSTASLYRRSGPKVNFWGCNLKLCGLQRPRKFAAPSKTAPFNLGSRAGRFVAAASPLQKRRGGRFVPRFKRPMRMAIGLGAIAVVAIVGLYLSTIGRL